MSEHDLFPAFRKQLVEEGYFVWRGLLDPSVIDDHLSALGEASGRFEDNWRTNGDVTSREYSAALKTMRYRFHVENPYAQRLVFHANLVDFLRFYFAEEPVMRQPETGMTHRGAPIHTDSLDLKIDPPGREIRIWSALEDVHPDAGPVYFYPRSHVIVSRTLEDEVSAERPDLLQLMQSLIPPTTSSEYFRVTKPIWSYIKGHKLPEAVHANALPMEPAVIKKGDCIVFDSSIVHGTCHCHNSQLTRRYFVAYWSARHARWFHSRSYWGSLHDFRCDENSIAAAVKSTPIGCQMDFQELQQSYFQSFGKPVVQPR